MKVSPSKKTNHLTQYYSNSEKYDSDVQAHKHAIYDSMSVSEFHSYFCEFSLVNDLGNGLTTYKLNEALLLYRFDQEEDLHEKQTETYALISSDGELLVPFQTVGSDVDDIIGELKKRGQK